MDFVKNHPLSPYTTLKIGGPAEYFYQATTKNGLLEALHSPIEPKTIIGNGSNVLVSDRGIPGLVIKNASSEITYLDNSQVLVASGTPLPLLITDTINHSLTGLEEFAYIPGTLGGAIWCNIHGVNRNNFDKFLVSIEVFDLNNSQTQSLKPDNLKWGYDFSEFQNLQNLIILSAIIQLSPGDSAISLKTFKEIIAKKAPVQPTNSVGSVFKNPPSDFAGRIIDQELGLKGFSVGDAQVSLLHANFIVNNGQATAADYLAVIRHIQSEAKFKLNLNLEPEIKFLGDFSKPAK